jgi:hypothetical protein
MRLWNTLHTLYRDKLAGRRSAGNKGGRSAERLRTRLEVEALDQRLLPSSVPNLGGLTMDFFPTPGHPNPWTSNNTLAITSVQDQGGGKGTFAAVYADAGDGVLTAVKGTITFKGPGGYGYDFGVTFSGYQISHFQFNPRTGIWSYDLSSAGGSGDFVTQAISGNADAYSYGIFSIPWYYFGQEADSLTYMSSYGDVVLGSHSGGPPRA